MFDRLKQNSQELQLLPLSGFLGLFLGLFSFGTNKNFHAGELFVGKRQNSHFAIRRKAAFDMPNMPFGDFSRTGQAHVYGILHHDETVFEQFISELRVAFPGFAVFSWQIKHYKYPHNLKPTDHGSLLSLKLNELETKRLSDFMEWFNRCNRKCSLNGQC